MKGSQLSPELVSLVHHIELNKAGWWDTAIQQLILAAIWRKGESLSLAGIVNELRKGFSVHLEASKVEKQIDELCASNTVVALPGGQFKIAERSLNEFEASVKQAKEITQEAESKFATVLAACCDRLEPAETWRSFNDDLLAPLVREMGARTYELVSGGKVEVENRVRFREFLESFPAEHRQGLRDAVIGFLDPKDRIVRSYILRQLNAYFFLEAGNLSEETVEALTVAQASKPSFTILVDTNFLFSMLGLHENPSNEAAMSLMSLASRLAEKVTLRFYVSPITIDEARRVLEAVAYELRYLRLSSNLAEVAVDRGLSGFARKFAEESRKAGHPLKAEDYFKPYITDLVGILRTKGVELAQDVDSYRTRQDVIDDLNDQLKFETRRLGERAKGYDTLLHDMVLWHFVNDQRPVRTESPLEAGCWIVTVDFRLLDFDRHKRARSVSGIPVCVHPAPLTEMLQFWIPRTQEFEEAMLGNLRLPFLFQDFDPAAEQVTIRILEALSRFENVGDLPQEVITATLMNQALRQRISVEANADVRVELTREAVIEQSSRLAAELGEFKKKTESSERVIAQLREQVGTSDADLQRERADRAKLEERVRFLEEQRASAEADADRAHARRWYVGKWVAAPLVLGATLAFIGGSAAQVWTGVEWWQASVAMGAALALACAGIADRIGSGIPDVSSWSLFHRFRGWRVRIYSALGAVALSAAGSALYVWMS